MVVLSEVQTGRTELAVSSSVGPLNVESAVHYVAGSRVKLVSGGMTMSVIGMEEGGNVATLWMDETGRIQRDSFPAFLLKAVLPVSGGPTIL